jgi:hypothetical protein
MGDAEMLFMSLVNIWDYLLNCQGNKTSTSASGFKEFYFCSSRTSKVIAHQTYGGRQYGRVQTTEMSHNYDVAHHSKH